MLKHRVISSIIGIPIILAFVLLGRITFTVFVMLLSVMLLSEFYSILKAGDYAVFRGLGLLGGIVIPAAALIAGTGGLATALVVTTILVFMAQTIGQRSITESAMTVIGLAYLAVLPSYLILLYQGAFGLSLVLLVLIGTWTSDIAAYAAGKAFGRTSLVPAISSKKTVEGAAAGLLAPAVLLAILSLLPSFPFIQRGWPVALGEGFLFGLVIGFVAPLGDLVESRFKREFDIKDSGQLIPGHGGFMDRFDSLLFTGVASYYLWVLLT